MVHVCLTRFWFPICFRSEGVNNAVPESQRYLRVPFQREAYETGRSLNEGLRARLSKGALAFRIAVEHLRRHPQLAVGGLDQASARKGRLGLLRKYNMTASQPSANLRDMVNSTGQEHLFAGFGELSAEQQAGLISDIQVCCAACICSWRACSLYIMCVGL